VQAMGLFDFFRKRKRLTPGDVRCRVEFDDTGVMCHRPDGTVESIKWPDLRAVVIQTTSEGPAVGDVFWLLLGENGGCVVPSESAGVQELMKRLDQLPGFDNEAVIAAMTCAEDREFVCWKKPVEGGR
jgi:hypothetical protein